MSMTFMPPRFFKCNPVWIYLVCSEREGQKPLILTLKLGTECLPVQRAFKFREGTIVTIH